jgi:hypothetical protein
MNTGAWFLMVEVELFATQLIADMRSQLDVDVQALMTKSH